MAQTHSLGNILRVVPIDFIERTPEENFDLAGDFVDEDGFFIRAEVSGYVTYCPINNKTDIEAITKWFDASYIFVDPEICRKIFNLGVTSPAQAGDIYVGYGV